MKHIDPYRYASTYTATQSFSFSSSGVADRINMGNVLDKEYNLAFSLFVWVKTSVTPATFGGLLTKEGSLAPFRGYALLINGSGQLLFGCVNTAPNPSLQVRTNSAINDGAWHLVGVTKTTSSAASGLAIYVDASSVATTTLRDTLATNTISNAFNFELGCRDVTANPYDGLMSNAYVFDKSLSGAEVTELYNGGTPIEASSLSFAANCQSHWRMDESDNPAGTVTDRVGANDGTSLGSSLALVNDYPT